MHNTKLNATVSAFLGEEDDHYPTAEEDDIVRQVREEVALEKKYKDLHGDSDDLLEKRFAAFSKDMKAVLQNAKPASGTAEPIKYNRVYVPPPKPFEEDEEDETEGWCCKYSCNSHVVYRAFRVILFRPLQVFATKMEPLFVWTVKTTYTVTTASKKDTKALMLIMT